ncbi:MAG: transporter substrate-binding domain-containing protein [Selenomonadaceae bacterium]|nr:transporter substrate-binding domain-containing protein [Selenomonadaceae bacterium]
MGNPYKYFNRTLLFILLLSLAMNIATPFSAHAQEPVSKTVRVGWYESPLCFKDRFGRRRGLDYEYQHKIAAYTGWTFEYVEDSWPNLLQKLSTGEIDLLSDVSYTEERTASMSFPDLPMGAESYYIYINAGNKELTSDNLTSFSGKKIGVNKGSLQEGLLNEWAQKHHVEIEIVPLTTGETGSMELLAQGEIDGFATINAFGARDKVVPVCRIGSSNYYYAVNKNRPDLLEDLNGALSAIQDEDPYFNQQIAEKNLHITLTNAFLPQHQEEWLSKHGVIRVGYQDNYLPFCSNDPKTGEVSGALKDYLTHAMNGLQNSNIRFEATPYPTVEAALEAMKTGDIDCIFPVNLSSYESDTLDIRLTNPAMNMEMHVIMRASDDQVLSRNSRITFAITKGNINIETFIKDYYPLCQVNHYPDLQSCFEAIASGKADCTLVNHFKSNKLKEDIEKYNLFSMPTKESIPLSFAVNKSTPDLYFILNKAVVLTKSRDVDSVLMSYVRSNTKVSFTQFFKEHWFFVVTLLSVVLLIINYLLLQKIKAERKASEQKRLLEEALKIAELRKSITALKNKNAATEEAYEKARSTSVIFTHIAKTLARGYTDFYYVDLDTEKYIEYRNDETSGEITETRRGENFFAACRKDAKRIVHPEDLNALLNMLDRQTFLDALNRNGIFMMPYRLISDQGPIYVNMRASRMDGDDRFIIIGITDINEQVKQRHAEEQMKDERIAYSRINALAGDYVCIYIVDPETERYREYTTTSKFVQFEIPKEGMDFFENSRINSQKVIYPEDLERFLSLFTKENVFATIEEIGVFTLTYRLMINEKPTYMRLKAAMVEEEEGRRLIVGVNDVDNQIRQEVDYAKLLAHAQQEATIDGLTGVKNKHSYLEAEEDLNRKIADHRAPEFAIVLLDVNDLKKINDTRGHQAGDEYIRSACEIICDIFKHSPVFRVGGDEFAVIVRGNNYQSIEELLGIMRDHNREALHNDGIVIACGMARYENDACVAAIFERADKDMYDNKTALKAAQKDHPAHD